MSNSESFPVETAVLAANAAFYRAFTLADLPAMQALWAERASVVCIHPGMPALYGRAHVLESWQQMLEQPPAFAMRCDRARVQLLGDSAIVTCYEGNAEHPAHLAATNIFVLEDERWRLVHHHAGPLMQPLPMPVPLSSYN